jgi:hypothetical protein
MTLILAGHQRAVSLNHRGNRFMRASGTLPLRRAFWMIVLSIVLARFDGSCRVAQRAGGVTPSGR